MISTGSCFGCTNGILLVDAVCQSTSALFTPVATVGVHVSVVRVFVVVVVARRCRCLGLSHAGESLTSSVTACISVNVCM